MKGMASTMSDGLAATSCTDCTSAHIGTFAFSSNLQVEQAVEPLHDDPDLQVDIAIRVRVVDRALAHEVVEVVKADAAILTRIRRTFVDADHAVSTLGSACRI